MNIAVFHDLPSGGAKRAVLEQTRGLRERGHRVDVFVPSTANEEFLPLEDFASSVRTVSLTPPPDRERILTGRPHPLDPVRWADHLLNVRTAAFRIAAAIDAEGYDVALVHPSQYTQAPWVLRALRTPSLYYCHEPLRAAYEKRIAPWPLRVLLRQTLGRVDRRNCRAADRVVVNSAFTAANVRRIYGIDPGIAWLGVDAERFRPRDVPRGDYVLAVGGLHPLKGVDFLIDALGRVPLPGRPPLLVVSDRERKSEKRRIVHLAAEHGVEVRFRFQIPEDELVTAYNAARLVLYAPYNEPFGLVPLEAMACGRPVLGVREGGIPETIRDGVTGFLVDRDVVAFARRVQLLLRNDEERERTGQRALALVQKEWTWERSVARLEWFCRATAEGSASELPQELA